MILINVWMNRVCVQEM